MSIHDCSIQPVIPTVSPALSLHYINTPKRKPAKPRTEKRNAPILVLIRVFQLQLVLHLPTPMACGVGVGLRNTLRW